MQATELKYTAKSVTAENIATDDSPNLIADYIELVERIFAQSTPPKKLAASVTAGHTGIRLIA